MNDGEGAVQRWIERAKAHVKAKVEHPWPVLKEQFEFRKTRRRGLAKNHSKVMVLAALSNLFLGPKKLLGTITLGVVCQSTILETLGNPFLAQSWFSKALL